MDFYSTKDVRDMTPEEIDLQYSPSCWSKLYKGDRNAVVQHHVDLVTERSNAAKAVVPNELGIKYGPTENQRLDIFGGNALPNDAPILVHFHGGYWQALHRDMSSYFVPPLFRKGIRAIIVGFDLAPAVSVAELNDQVKTAAEYIMKYARKIGSKSISFSGHCAGAQIVMDLVNSEWMTSLNDVERRLIKSLLLISGVYDLTLLIDTHVNDPLKLTMDSAYKSSPMFYDDKDYYPARILVMYGEYDTPEYKRQSNDYAKKLSKANKDVAILHVPKVDHFELVEQLVDENFMPFQKMVEYILNNS